GSDGVLVGPKRFCDPSLMLGGSGTVAAPDFQHPAAYKSVFSLCALSFALLRRSGVPGISVGSAFVGGWLPGASSEHRDKARHLAAAMAAVPLHVTFGCGQAPE